MTLKFRKRLAIVALAISIIAAAYISIPHDRQTTQQLERVGMRGNALTDLIDTLNRIEWAHISGHLIIFGSIAFWLGAWGKPGERGSADLAMAYILVGGILMELMQIVVGHMDDETISLITNTLYDLVTDILAACVGIWVAGRYGDRIMNIAGISTNAIAHPIITDTDDQFTPGTRTDRFGSSG